MKLTSEGTVDLQPATGGHPGRLCGFALASVILLPWGLIPLWHLVGLILAEGRLLPEFFGSGIYRFLVLPLCLVSMVVATVCGRHSAARIRKGGGTPGGMPLAVLGALFYPVLLFNLFLLLPVGGMMNIPVPAGSEMPVTPPLPVLLLVVVAGNAMAWGKTARAMREGKSCLRAAAIPLFAWLVMLVWCWMVVAKLRGLQLAAAERRFEEVQRAGEEMIRESDERSERLMENVDAPGNENGVHEGGTGE